MKTFFDTQSNTTSRYQRTRKAIRISLVVSIVVFAIKFSAYIYTGANSVLSDAAESFIHIFAVGFSAFGIYFSQKPPDYDHPYGHERIGFFAIGAEGMLIVIAALTIFYQSIRSLVTGIEVFNLGAGAGIVFASAVINLLLGIYLVRVGKREENMIIVGNGKHTLTDVYTSGGVLLTLFLISWTGYLFLDAIVAMAIAAYISLEGYRLLRYATKGLMDQSDPEIDDKIRDILDKEVSGSMKGWHALRHRNTGDTHWVEFHILFEKGLDLEKAHKQATILEKKIMDRLGGHVVVTAHLEPEQQHVIHHKSLRDNNEGNE